MICLLCTTMEEVVAGIGTPFLPLHCPSAEEADTDHLSTYQDYLSYLLSPQVPLE